MGPSEQIRGSVERLQEYARRLDGAGDNARLLAAREIVYLLSAAYKLMPEEMGMQMAKRMEFGAKEW